MALTLRIVGSLGESLANRKLDPIDYFRVARNSIIDTPEKPVMRHEGGEVHAYPISRWLPDVVTGCLPPWARVHAYQTCKAIRGSLAAAPVGTPIRGTA